MNQYITKNCLYFQSIIVIVIKTEDADLKFIIEQIYNQITQKYFFLLLPEKVSLHQKVSRLYLILTFTKFLRSFSILWRMFLLNKLIA